MDEERYPGFGPCLEYRGSRKPEGYGQANLGESYTDRHGHVRRMNVGIHRHVMERALGRKLGPKEVVRHQCDNPPCFRFDHLLLGTHADNIRDRDERGRAASTAGESNGQSKLTEVQILAIFQRKGSTQRELAEEFGISEGHVSYIRSGKRWAHVTARIR